MTTINDNNYELWLLRYAEGELTEAEQNTVEQWLELHPDAKEMLALYVDAPHLEPDEDVRYTGTVPGMSRMLWPVVLRWSAAAAVLAAMLLPLALHQRDEAMPVEVAKVQRLPDATEPRVEPEPLPKTETDVYVAPQECVMDQPANIEAVMPIPVPMIYVDNLIVYDEEDTVADEKPVALAMVQEERVNNGISVPRLIGSIIKSNIKTNNEYETHND